MVQANSQKEQKAKADREGPEIAHYLAALTLTLTSVVRCVENYNKHFGTNKMESVLSASYMIKESANAKQIAICLSMYT